MSRLRAAVPIDRERALLRFMEWLSGDECQDLDDAALVAQTGRRLRTAGLPLDRLVAHRPSLHPGLGGRLLAWTPGGPTEIRDGDIGDPALPSLGEWAGATPEHQGVRHIGKGDVAARAWLALDPFRGRGLVDLAVAPLAVGAGAIGLFCLATARPTGFAASDLDFLDRLLPSLERAIEMRLLRQIELPVLDALLGRPTAKRVMSGTLHRGVVETIGGALMLVDLMPASGGAREDDDERRCAQLGDCVDTIGTIVALSGGVTLRAGETMLVVFPRDDLDGACAAALRAAGSVSRALVERCRGAPRIALHCGQISYASCGVGVRRDMVVAGGDHDRLKACLAAGVAGHGIVVSTAFGDRLGASKNPDEHGLQIVNASPLG